MPNLWCWYLAKLLILPLRRRIWPMEAVYDLSVAHNHMTINQRKDTHRDALKRDKTQSTRCSPMHSLMSTETNTVLTISWHHTQRLPAKVLIFLWHTWHLVELPSALIQSWAAIWHTEEQKKEIWRKRCNSLQTNDCSKTTLTAWSVSNTQLFSHTVHNV